MTDHNWSDVSELFEAALEVEASEREAFLRERAPHDAELRAEVASLLDAHDGEGTVDRLADELAGSTVSRLLRGPEPGDLIDAYRIVRRIGRGGMGAVYLAERDDPKLRQQVALKILQLGLNSEELLQRFFAERQILAGLQHPNIALLLDGGATEDGLPYFTMEFVEGRPIDAHCEERSLGPVERLALMERVCDAVEYAHSRSVVHRDLKPSNILVREDGVPKVVDFGIAKLVGDGPDQSALATLTRTDQRRLTLEYASPEQVRGGEITPASDVYSLGILLYRLLADRAPYTTEGRTQGEVERLICEEPVAPPGLGSGLDQVLLKALEKRPEDRFASAGALGSALAEASARALATTANPRPRWPAVAGIAALLSLGAFGLWQSSRSGEGAPTAQTAAVPSAVPGESGRAQVLWVDDRPENNRQEADELWERGFEVVTATSTVEATRLYRPGRFVGVVSDLGRWEEGEYHPEAGFELLDALRTQDADIEFVFYTSPATVDALRDRMLESGAAGIPTTPEQLVGIIENFER